MENTQKFKTSSEHVPNAKRKKVLAAVAHEMVTSDDDDDNIVDAMNICDIIESHHDNHKQPTSSKAINALGETIRNTLLEINEAREQNRERRHKELIEILQKIVLPENVTSNSQASKNKKIYDESVISLKEEEDDPTISEQYIIDEIKTEAIVDEDEELCNTNSNSTLTNVNSLVDSKDSKMYKLSETVVTPLTAIIKPLKNVTRAVVVNKSQSDLEEMRIQMLEMQRQKMEDRVRKKRKFLHIQN